MKSKSLNPFIAAFAGCLLATPVFAQTNRTWTGSGGSAWNTAGSWTGGVPDDATEVAFFGANTTNDPASFSGIVTLGGFNFAGGEGRTLTFTGDMFLDQYGIVVGDASNFAITGAGTTTLTANQTWAVNSAGNTFTFSRTTLATDGYTLTLSGSATGTGTISANITGLGGITKTGTGTWILSGTANSYSGFTTISNGVLNIRHTDALGGTVNGTSVASGAALQIQGGIITAAEALALDGTGLSNTGALRNISDDNTYTGAITINSSTRINSDSGTLTLNVASGNAITGSDDNLTFGGVGNITVADAIATGTGTLTKDGNGTLTLNGTNTYTGTTTLSAGTLVLGDASALGSGNLNFTGGVLGLGAGDFTRALGTAANQVQFAAGTGGGFAAYGGNRFVNLGGAGATVTWNSGSFVLTGDSLKLSAADADSTVDFQNPLALNGAARTVQVDDGSAAIDAVISGVISGNISSDLVKTGAGTLSLTQSNTFTGDLTLDAGTLILGHDSAAGLGTLVISAGTTIQGSGGARTIANNLDINGNLTFSGTENLDFTDSFDQTASRVYTVNNTTAFSGAITGGDNLTKSGIGTLILRGTNAIGTTTVNSGTLILDYGTNDTTKLNSTLILGGGTVHLTGGSHVEAVTATTINAGASAITRNVSGTTATLQLNVITRNAGGTLNLGAASIATTDTDNANGILGTWFTVAGTDWAAKVSSADDDLITAYSGYTDVTRLSSGTKAIANVDTTNVRIIEGTGSLANITLGATTTVINTLNQSISGGTNAATIDAASRTLRVGGILVGTGAGGLTIGTAANSGTLTAKTSGGELILHNHSSNGLAINSTIAGFGTSTLTKSGAGTVILNGTNTYDGITSINEGTLIVNGDQSAANGAMSVASVAALLGTGTIGGATTILGTHSPGASAGAVGTQNFSSSLTYSSGSIFEWDLNVTSGTATFDKVVAGSLGGSGAEFKIVGSGDGYASAFWDSTRNWTATELFGVNNATVNLSDIFTTTTSFNPSPLQGSFSFTNAIGGGTGNQLTWTAVPEPTSALAGILLGAGLLRRKRTR